MRLFRYVCFHLFSTPSYFLLIDTGAAGSKMMHDFAASSRYSILLDLPLSLDPLNLPRGEPIVAFAPTTPSRFGVLPRYRPDAVRWYEGPSCIIFHTAFAYDTPDDVHLICCRLNSARLVYAAGNLPTPPSQLLPPSVDDTCLLYYYRFPLHISGPDISQPSHAFPLCAIPFEFPIVRHDRSMSDAQFVYGCSMKKGSFSAALGSSAKIDCIVKVNVQALIARGTARGGSGEEPVDQRAMSDFLDGVSDGEDSISVFALPDHHFAQEVSFVPRRNGQFEDDGFLLTYVFDERQMDKMSGEPIPGARSELWVFDARNMKDVVAKVVLPQRGKLFVKSHDHMRLNAIR